VEPFGVELPVTVPTDVLSVSICVHLWLKNLMVESLRLTVGKIRGFSYRGGIHASIGESAWESAWLVFFKQLSYDLRQ
jgi:hypothetical protein